MSSEHPFDERLRTTMQGFEPDVKPSWTAFESLLRGGTPAASTSATVNRWALAAAVVAGGAAMWVVQPLVVDALSDNGRSAATSDPSLAGGAQAAATSTEVDIEQAQRGSEVATFEQAWEEFVSLRQEFVEDHLSVEGEAALAGLNEPTSETRDRRSATTGQNARTDEAARAEGASSFNATSSVGSPSGTSGENDGGARGSKVSTASSEERLLSELPFNASTHEACEGVEVAFELSGLDRAMSFLWNFGDGHFSSDPAPVHRFDRPGTYDITLNVRAPRDGSIHTRTIQNMITVLPKPEADFSWSFELGDKPGRVRVHLSDDTENATGSHWVVDGKSTTSDVLQLDVPGSYPVNLVTSNKYGCLDDANHDIVVGNRQGILAQARFSPNGDGHYDTFMPHGLVDMRDVWVLVIQDKRGQEIFRTSKASKPWDGKLPNGDVAQDREVFQWTVTCRSEEGHVRLFTDRLRVER
jgi:PKD repeat protein